jgi:hypothetical protein
MSAIVLSAVLRRRLGRARRSLPEFIVWCWFAIALGLTTAVIVLVISSTVALAFLGVAMLVQVLPWAAVLALCVVLVAATVARIIRRFEM